MKTFCMDEKIAEVRVGKLAASAASLLVALVAVPAFMVLSIVLPYAQDPQIRVGDLKVYIFLYIFLFLLLHELLLAFAFFYFGGVPYKKIKLGFEKVFVPYLHCNAPMEVRTYRICMLFPLLFAGSLTLIWLLISPAIWTAYFLGITVALCVGDLWVSLKLRGFDNRLLVQPHPSEIGCDVFTHDAGDTLDGRDSKV